jgi:hypothetical protein
MTTAGKLIGKSRWVIQSFIRQGLPFVPTGKRHKLILVSELEKWLKARQVTA